MDICHGNIMEHMGHSLFESYTSVMVVFELSLLLVDRLLAFGDEVLNNDSLEKKRLIIINVHISHITSFYWIMIDRMILNYYVHVFPSHWCCLSSTLLGDLQIHVHVCCFDFACFLVSDLR